MTRCSWKVRLGSLAFLVVLVVLVPQQVETAKTFSAWSAPVNLGPVVNSAFEEFLPEMSKNELSLYFASNRPGPFGGEDLWVSRRATRNDDWGEPLNLGPNVNTSFNERSPALSRDGHLLFFASTRPGGSGGFDIWVSWRAHTRDDFGWQPPVNLGTGVNGAFGDFGPTFFENDDIGIPNLFFASSRPGVGGVDIYRSELGANGSFGSAMLIPELSTPHNDFRPTIRPDGLEVFFDSNRPGGIGLRDLWVSMRETTSNAWSTPVNLGPAVNTGFNDTLPALSSDGMTLIFTSDRPGFGGSDLYMSARARQD
jgi:Tol biopolymer transport system component